MEAALELRGVRKRFGQSEIVRGINLRVHKGERHALIGPNGAGKSTTFNLISGRFAPSAGSIHLHGRDIGGLPPHTINHLGLSRSFQITSLFANLSVYDNLRCAVLWSLGYKYSLWRQLDKLRDARERAEEVMALIGLAPRKDVLAGTLAYAEQRALEIGLTIAGGADVLLLDEPTAGMSRTESDQAIALIRKVSEGKTLVMVEHDMGVVFGVADRISVLVYGEVIITDTPQAIRDSQLVRDAYLGATLDKSTAKLEH